MRVEIKAEGVPRDSRVEWHLPLWSPSGGNSNRVVEWCRRLFQTHCDEEEPRKRGKTATLLLSLPPLSHVAPPSLPPSLPSETENRTRRASEASEPAEEEEGAVVACERLVRRRRRPSLRPLKRRRRRHAYFIHAGVAKAKGSAERRNEGRIGRKVDKREVLTSQGGRKEGTCVRESWCSSEEESSFRLNLVIHRRLIG